MLHSGMLLPIEYGTSYCFWHVSF